MKYKFYSAQVYLPCCNKFILYKVTTMGQPLDVKQLQLSCGQHGYMLIATYLYNALTNGN